MTDLATPTTPPLREARAARTERLRLLVRSPTVVVGTIVVAFWVFCAIFPDLIAPYDPIFDNQFPTNLPPEWGHVFGTDTNGRDILSRVLAGSRNIIVIALAATLLGTILGTTLGLVTGYFRGIADDGISRLVDAFMALPLIVTAILIVTAVGSSGTWVVTLTIAVIFMPVVSRTVRAGVLGETELDYVQAARLRGERSLYIMFSEILPNVLPLVVVEFTVRLGYAIFTVASLSFLGFGVAPPSPDWAAQINQYWTLIDPYWWMTLFPALAIATLVVAVNLVSDGIREVYER